MLRRLPTLTSTASLERRPLGATVEPVSQSRRDQYGRLDVYSVRPRQSERNYDIVGEKSPMPIGAGREPAQLVPRGRLAIVPAAGHLPWFEHQGVFGGAQALRVSAIVSGW